MVSLKGQVKKRDVQYPLPTDPESDPEFGTVVRTVVVRTVAGTVVAGVVGESVTTPSGLTTNQTRLNP
jgi:hypothetical protein